MTYQRTDIPVLLSESLSLFCLQSPRGQIVVAVTSALFVLIAAYLFVLARSVEHLPKSLPWAGRRDEPFSKVRASFREYYKGWTTLKEGQEQYGRNGLPFVLPQPTFRSLVILPQEYMKWMLKQPEAILSARVVQWELFGIQYLVPAVVSDVHIHLVNIMINTMRTKLKGSITLLQSRLVDQVVKSVDTQMGFDEAEWKDIGLFDFMTKVTCQTTLRVWVGETMFHNKAFVDAYNTFTLWFGASSLMMSSWIPPVFSTVLGLLLQIPIKICTYRCNKHVLPIIRKRWEQVEKMKRGLSVEDDVPNDFITWNVEAAMAEKYSKTSCPEYLSTHLLLFAVGGIPTAGFIGTNVFMDLLSSDRKFFECIRQEAEEVFGTVTDPTDATLLTKLSYTDSAIRESLRLNPFLISFPQRKVIHENGVTLPDGTHLPQNAWIGSSILDVHQNEKYYSHAKDYRPFRFIEANQENGLKAGNESMEKPDTVLVTVGEDFFGFGAGRHTCPGRWLAAAQLKLILAYVTLHYDIKPLACRPANQRMGEVNIPNRHFKIQVRRRSVEAGSTLQKIQERFHEWASSEKCLPDL